MEYTRNVHCSDDEFAGDTPEVMVVDIAEETATRIRELAAWVKTLDVKEIVLFDRSPKWYLPDWDQEGESPDAMYPVAGEEYTSLDLYMLHIEDDCFWWTANLKCAGVVLTCETIAISELT